MAPSTRRQTADALITAFNAMDIPTILSFRSPTCLRHLLPTSMGYPPITNAEYGAHLARLKPIFRNFSLTLDDVLEDAETNRICLYLRARADTVVGVYVNEYMWTLDFDSEGLICGVREFVDTVMERDFWPKLAGAMREREGKGGEVVKGVEVASGVDEVDGS